MVKAAIGARWISPFPQPSPESLCRAMAYGADTHPGQTQIDYGDGRLGALQIPFAHPRAEFFVSEELGAGVEHLPRQR